MLPFLVILLSSTKYRNSNVYSIFFDNWPNLYDSYVYTL